MMPEIFNLEIISPDKTLIKSEVQQVTIPAFEGLMTILKDHISIITFLRPGFVEAEISGKTQKFYVEEGTVEFSNNQLLILSSTAINVDNLTKDLISKMIKETKANLKQLEIKDKEKYILNHKVDSLQEIN